MTSQEMEIIINQMKKRSQGVNGEIYPCKPDIFEKTYERVEA